ncbi:MAG: spore photoproduct lyase family protein, partial [Paraclostridium sp.]
MFKPNRVIFEKGTLETEIGKNIYEQIKNESDVEVIHSASNRVKSNIPGKNLHEQYREGKKTLVVGIRKTLKFQTCKPSAHYQLPLVSGCMGQCEYCYLNTQLGDKPFVKVFVNIDD